MNQKKRQEIDVLASTIREGLELSIPIDVEEAVRRLGGELVELNQLENNMEAKVRKNGERFQIFIAKNKPQSRKRFSIAHELGHLLLHMGYLLNPDLWSATEEYCDSVYYRFGHGVEENEANEFAASFLMPQSEFQEAAQQSIQDGFYNIEDLANRFQTSKDAAVKRGKTLGVFDTAI